LLITDSQKLHIIDKFRISNRKLKNRLILTEKYWFPLPKLKSSKIIWRDLFYSQPARHPNTFKNIQIVSLLLSALLDVPIKQIKYNLQDLIIQPVEQVFLEKSLKGAPVLALEEVDFENQLSHSLMTLYLRCLGIKDRYLNRCQKIYKSFWNFQCS